MPSQRFAPPSEVPGLAARRIAADIVDGVLHKHRTLDGQLDGSGAHPGLKTLADRDRALMRGFFAQVIPGREHSERTRNPAERATCGFRVRAKTRVPE